VSAGLNKHGLSSLKSILHFSGISLYELMLVSNASTLFTQAVPRRAVEELQFHKYAMVAMRPLVHFNEGREDCELHLMVRVFCQGCASDQVLQPHMSGVDVWGNRGPDAMSHALSLYVVLTENNGGCRAEMGADGDFSQASF
jgi:hypothetical protein